MNIGLDMDGVVADFVPALINFHNRYYQPSLKVQDVLSYNLWEVWGGTRENAIKKMHLFYESQNFKDIKPIPGSVDGVTYLKNNHKLMVVTARPDYLFNKTKIWVNKYFNGAFAEIHFANHFSYSGRPKKKSDICKILNLDYLVEDSLENMFDCHNDKTKVILFDQPWNQHHKLPDGVRRVKTWKEIQSIFTSSTSLC